MSTISDNAMHVWTNGETIALDKLEQNRKVFETAINDNQGQIINLKAGIAVNPLNQPNTWIV